MAFKINARPEFTRTVTIIVPQGDGEVEETLLATFRVTARGDRNLARSDHMTEFLTEAIVKLDDVVDEHDKPIYSTPELIAGVLAMDNARLALMRTYSEAVTQLKLGN